MQQLQYIPFQDPQAKPPVRFCGICGREVYAPEGLCLYCAVHGT